MRRLRRILTGLFLFALVIVGARLAAPHYVLKYVNRTLDELDGYSGHVADVDLNLWRGAYVIKGVTIRKTAGHTSIPLLDIERIDISVQWKALFEGAIVGEIELFSPKLNIVAEKHEEPKAEGQAEKRDAQRIARGKESTWQTQVKELVPLEINRVGIYDGEIHFRDPYTKPKVNVFIQDFHGEVTNLTNSADLAGSLVAHAQFRARAMRSGRLHLDADVDPYQMSPTFKLAAELEDLQIKQLNDFLKAYANVDAEKGTLSVYTEVKAAKQHFHGYVKPIIRNLKIIRWKEETEGLGGKLWETLVAGVSEIFENHPKNQFATKVVMHGKVDKPKADVFETVVYVLRNAFIEALKSGLDSQLDLGGSAHASAADSND
jgi:hypothetical protein